MIIVGGLGFAPEIFYNLTLRECQLIVEGDKKHQEQFLFNMSYAVINGIGSTFGDKKFKFINPFGDEKKKKKTNKPDKEKLLKDMRDLKKMFNK